MLLLLCTSTPLVLCCDRCDCGSRQIKRDLVDLVTVDYDITLHWRLLTAHEDDTNGGNHRPLLVLSMTPSIILKASQLRDDKRMCGQH